MERQWQSNEPPLAAIEECKTTFDLLHSRISSDPGVPVQDPTTSFWQQTPLFPDLVNMKSQNLPESADIVIIGSGITGLSVAYTILTELKAMGMQRQVVMLEARQACSGATGRNGGHIKVAAYEVYSRNKARYGKERAKAIVLFQLRHLPTLMDLERAKNLEGADIRKVETVDLFMDVAMFLKSQEMVEELRDELPELAQDVRIWEGDAARRVS